VNIIIDSDFASRHTAPSQLDVIFHVKLSGPHQYLREYLKGSRAIKTPSVARAFLTAKRVVIATISWTF